MHIATPRLRAARVWAIPVGLAVAFGLAEGAAQPAPSPPRSTSPAPPGAPSAQRLRAFTTPEDAVRSLIEALQAPTVEPLVLILGRTVLDSVPLSERQADERRRAAGGWLSLQRFEIDYLDAERRRAVALFGNQRVPLPAELVRTPRGWAFDQAATIAAMRERRIGVNEANAIQALHALAEAQARYRVSDRRRDGVLEYARRIRSSGPGRLDGLVASEFEAAPGVSTDLLNTAFAQAEGEPGDPRLKPPGGYAYKILTGQGPHAEGGTASYLVGDRMTEGFAVVAWPVRPGETGLSTFVMNHRGQIFEREFGDRTAEEVRRMTIFDPGPGWTPVQAPE